MARLPEAIACFTTAPPPVTTTTLIPACFIRACALSMVGSAMQATRSCGPPLAMIASLIQVMTVREIPFAPGWTLNTTELPPAIMLIALLMMVSVGLVDGVMESSVPKGARSCKVSPSSPVKATVSRISSPGVFSIATRFLMIL